MHKCKCTFYDRLDGKIPVERFTAKMKITYVHSIFTMYTKPWIILLISPVLCEAFSQVKSSHIYLYSAFNNTNFVKATAQYQNRKIVYP